MSDSHNERRFSKEAMDLFDQVRDLCGVKIGPELIGDERWAARTPPASPSENNSPDQTKSE
jgi:hypothetical protein